MTDIPPLPDYLPDYDTADLPGGAVGSHISPNVCLQSALFGLIPKGQRKYLNGVTIVSYRGVSINYTGEQLDQGDLDVLIHAIHLTARAKNNCRTDGLVHFPIRGFLAGIGRKPGKSGQKWLLNSIRRLSASNIEIRTKGQTVFDNYSIYGGSLINDYFYDPREQKYYLRINSSLGSLFDRGWTKLSWQQRLQLSGDLTRWLHGLYSSTQPYATKVSTLLSLSGSRCKRLSDFRRHVKKSLNELVSIGMLKSWKIDEEDKVHVRTAKNK